jgi:SAM-dependent methyltransferase
VEEVFADIIQKGKWSQHPCGPGSTMEYTEHLRKNLIPFLKKQKINSILDLPCGDFSWINTTEIDKKFDYIGADIVKEMIDENKQKYPTVDFRVLDLTTDKLPSVDLLFCRDCLLHLSFSDIEKALKNIANSDIKYVLLSNWYDAATNERDIETGSWRYIDFRKEPYNFRGSISSIKDWIPGFSERKMILWPIKTIRKYVENSNAKF